MPVVAHMGYRVESSPTLKHLRSGRSNDTEGGALKEAFTVVAKTTGKRISQLCVDVVEDPKENIFTIIAETTQGEFFSYVGLREEDKKGKQRKDPGEEKIRRTKAEGCFVQGLRPAALDKEGYPVQRGPGQERGEGYPRNSPVEKAFSLRPSDNTYRRPPSAFFVFNVRSIFFLPFRSPKAFSFPRRVSLRRAFSGGGGGGGGGFWGRVSM
eukprot:Gb_16260 [translate_table: standard]